METALSDLRASALAAPGGVDTELLHEVDAALGTSTGALPASRKVWKAGTLHPEIRVPMREIALHLSAGEPDVRVYDSSGPYTDPEAAIDTAAGLPRHREAWIAARGDTETYLGRATRPEDNGRDEASGKLRPFPRAQASDAEAAFNAARRDVTHW